jgi:hypothetical protein
MGRSVLSVARLEDQVAFGWKVIEAPPAAEAGSLSTGAQLPSQVWKSTVG